VTDITLTQALTQPELFGKVFAAPSFWTWKVVAKLIDGKPLTEPRELALYRECTGRTTLPSRSDQRRLRRFIFLVGRRGGKDRFWSAVAVWRAALCTDWRKHLSAGEQAVVILLGRDKKQAGILRRYCRGLLQMPLLAQEVARETGDFIEFRNGAVLEIASNDAALVRGRSAIGVFGSEASFWKVDDRASSSDEEVVGAAEPSMAMCPDGGLLVLWSSVHRRRGYMFRKFRDLHANDEAEDLCWFAPSRVMNPALRQSVIDDALAEDGSRARAEYLNHWREDVADFLPHDVIEACTDYGVYERPPVTGVRYFAYCDAAGGTGRDSFTLCIAHRAPDGSLIIDATRERKPRFVPSQVVSEFAPLLATYRITQVRGDQYAFGFHLSEWRNHNITLMPPQRSTSENYLYCLPALLANRVRLVDNKTLRNQLGALERRVGSGDKETVDHPQHASAHDDLAAAVCGAIATVLSASRTEIKFAPPPFIDGQGVMTLAGQATAQSGADAANAKRPPREWMQQHTEPWRPYYDLTYWDRIR
jgi:hypothetical protein